MSASSFFVVSLPDHDADNIDSIWSTEEAALERAATIGQALVSEYRADVAAGWVRNGWSPPSEPPSWSDWGESLAPSS